MGSLLLAFKFICRFPFTTNIHYVLQENIFHESTYAYKQVYLYFADLPLSLTSVLRYSMKVGELQTTSEVPAPPGLILQISPIAIFSLEGSGFEDAVQAYIHN